MRIRAFTEHDLEAAVALTIETFRPFYEDYVRHLLGPAVFPHQHANWEQDYRDDVPTLHRPDEGRHMAVAESDDDIVGLVAWRPGGRPLSGQVYLVAVDSGHRQQGLGRQLCLRAIDAMKATGVEVVSIGTGNDEFHRPARALYESLGFTPIPTMAYLRAV